MKSKQLDKEVIGFTKNYLTQVEKYQNYLTQVEKYQNYLTQVEKYQNYLTQVEKYQNYLSDNKFLYFSFNEINKLLKIAIETVERKSNRA